MTWKQAPGTTWNLGLLEFKKLEYTPEKLSEPLGVGPSSENRFFDAKKMSHQAPEMLSMTENYTKNIYHIPLRLIRLKGNSQIPVLPGPGLVVCAKR